MKQINEALSVLCSVVVTNKSPHPRRWIKSTQEVNYKGETPENSDLTCLSSRVFPTVLSSSRLLHA